MKTPNLTQKYFALSLTLAFALVPFGSTRAELVNEEVQADAITPETSALEEEMVILKKPTLPAKKKRIVVREETLPMEEAAYAPVASAQAQAHAQAQASSQSSSVGSRLDEGMQNKMNEVKTEFENALLKSLDRIKISVDDGGSAASASASASAEAEATAAPAMTTTIVQDSIVNSNAAPGYMSLDSAPSVEGYEEDVENASVAEAEKEEESFANSVRLSPVFGITSINSDIYEIDARYTAGINIEVDVSDNLAAVLGYSYSQYDISLGSSNPFFSGWSMPNYWGQGNLTSLQYNQNVFDAGLRFYLFPKTSKFRVFVGGGLGYNKGYLNYRQGVFNTYASNPYTNLEDYEVTSFLGIMETGAEITVAKNVALGANFKYANVLSSRENQSLNNYGFAMNGYGSNISQDQRVVGGSIAENSFYSILGTVKVSF